MGQARIYVFCPDLKTPLGGVRMLYRHVDILNENGFDAAIVHREKGFRIPWFEHRTKVIYEPAPMRKTDIGVFPEIWGPDINRWGKTIRKVIFNQNAYYTFMAHPLKGEFEPPYLNPQVVATIVVSEDSRRYLEYVFPRMPVHRIRYSIDSSLYFPEEKKKQICVMPRKNLEDVKQVLHILRCREALQGWSIVLVDHMSEVRAATMLRQSAIFLSFGSPEGFGLPPAEALRCGTIVVGYCGRGGSEFLTPAISFPIDVGDIVGFAQTAERVMQKYSQNSDSFREMSEGGMRFISENYSRERERDSIVECWKRILRD